MTMNTPLVQTIGSVCERLANPNPAEVTLAAVIAVGILISYIPQHIKIIQNGTSEGLSPWWVLLGGLSSTAAIGNIMTLPASREDLKCCKSIAIGDCIAASLGIVQIGMQFTCFMLIVLLFTAYASNVNHGEENVPLPASTIDAKPDTRRSAVIVAFTTLTGVLFTLIASVIFISALPHHTQKWANFLGTVGGVLATIQYLPQIYYTYHLGDVKSLSMLTMMIQLPGAFLFALSLWLRVGWEGWSAWAVYVVTAVLQAVLFILAVYYTLQQRSEGKRKADQQLNGDASTADADERTALLNNR